MQPLVEITTQFSGPYEPADETFQFHESAGGRNLAVRSGRLHACFVHAIRDGEVLSLRVEQPASLSPRLGHSGESVLCL